MLAVAGEDAVHTLELSRGNRTPDIDIATFATDQQRILISKDGDFVTLFFLRRAPAKLLLVSTGNTSNNLLVELFEKNLPRLREAFLQYDFVELGKSAITIHQ